MKDLRIAPSVLGDIADGLLRGGRALDEAPEVTVPDAGEVTADLTAALSTLYESAANAVAAFGAIADGIGETASMIAATDEKSSGVLAQAKSMFEELTWH